MKTRLPLLLLVALVLCAGICAGGCAARQGDAKDFRLTILHTNDVHAAYGGFTAQGILCYSPLCPGGQGGIVRLERAVRLARAQDPDALLLDAGDQSLGSLFYTKYKESVPAVFLPRLGYTAMTPGNHEFDEGCDLLRSLSRAMATPIVAANLELGPEVSAKTGGAEKQPGHSPWIVVEKKGRRIGIVGLVTPSTRALGAPCAESRFTDPKDALRNAVSELSARGVDIIIALTHLGLTEDRDLARSVDGVDVIVGGHSHSLLSNTDPKAVGPYPIVEKSPSGQPVPIVTAFYGGRLLGRLSVAFDAEGRPTAWEGAPLSLTDAGLAALDAEAQKTSPAQLQEREQDQDIFDIINQLAEPIQEMLRQPVGWIDVPGLAPGRLVDEPNALVCRVRECVTGNVITDAMLDAVKDSKVQLALFSGGSIRSPLLAGEQTAGALLDTAPFENKLFVGNISGKTLLEMLEHGVSRREDAKGYFLQVSGLRYALDPAQPAGKRIVSAAVREPHTGTYLPVRPGASYRIVTIDYLAGGGDLFAMLPALAWKDTGLNLSDVLRDYVARHSPLSPRQEGRIRVSGEK